MIDYNKYVWKIISAKWSPRLLWHETTFLPKVSMISDNHSIFVVQPQELRIELRPLAHGLFEDCWWIQYCLNNPHENNPAALYRRSRENYFVTKIVINCFVLKHEINKRKILPMVGWLQFLRQLNLLCV